MLAILLWSIFVMIGLTVFGSVCGRYLRINSERYPPAERDGTPDDVTRWKGG